MLQRRLLRILILIPAVMMRGIEEEAKGDLGIIAGAHRRRRRHLLMMMILWLTGVRSGELELLETRPNELVMMDRVQRRETNDVQMGNLPLVILMIRMT